MSKPEHEILHDIRRLMHLRLVRVAMQERILEKAAWLDSHGEPYLADVIRTAVDDIAEDRRNG